MHILENVSLKDLTTFKLGGPSRFFTYANTLQDLKDAVVWAQSNNIPIFVLGEGSNVLVADEGFPGLVIKNELKGITLVKSNNHIEAQVGAGENWDTFVAHTIAHNAYGLENLSGIPGTVGATPIQNIGAYGAEVKDVIRWVEVFNIKTLKLEVLQNKECAFAYRDSIFKTKEGEKFIVTKVGYRLKKSGVPNIRYRDLDEYFKKRVTETPSLEEIRKAVLTIRSKKFPDIRKVGTGGSFFKNPILTVKDLKKLQKRYPDIPFHSVSKEQVKVPLAWILEHVCAWKGVRRGHVGVFNKQPIVLVHYGKGSTEEIKKLAYDIKCDVFAKTNIIVVPEVLYV